MKQAKAYLKISNEDFKDNIEKLLMQCFEQQMDIFWESNIAKIIVYNHDNFSYTLKQAIQMMISDFFIDISCLIVPKFNDLFLNYLDLVHNNVVTAFEIFVQHYNQEQTKQDMIHLIRDVKKEYLETANVFLKCNMNACEAAKELYLHRNSFNYRMNQFIYTSEMDIRDFDTAIFLKLIFASYLF